MSTDDLHEEEECRMDEEERVESTTERESLIEREQFLQESRTDIERDNINGRCQGEGMSSHDVRAYEDDIVDELPQQSRLDGQWPLLENVENNICMPQECRANDVDINIAQIERYGNYLERYGPHLERYGHHLERFGSQLERYGPDLERYGPQLMSFGRHMERPFLERNGSELERQRGQQNLNLQPPNEFASSSSNDCFNHQRNDYGRQTSWLNAPNPRRLMRRPSFQFNDGLLRQWMRRRNLDSRDIVQFNRTREDRERRRTNWRNDDEVRESRWFRGGRSYHEHDFGHDHGMPSLSEVERENFGSNSHERSTQTNSETENAGLLQQDSVRIPHRSHRIHQDDPDFGFVLLDDRNTSGPSDVFNMVFPTIPERRPRSHMSLQSLRVAMPPLGPIAEYNGESDEERYEQRPDFRRRSFRRRQGGNTIRSWAMMNAVIQPRPIFIGQGDSKVMNGPFTLQHYTIDNHNPFNGLNDRHRPELSRIPRPIPRFPRAERRERPSPIAPNQGLV